MMEGEEGRAALRIRSAEIAVAALFFLFGAIIIWDSVRLGWTWGADGPKPCYRCIYHEPPPPGLVPSCQEAGVLGVLAGTIGALQAGEALKEILGIGETLAGRLLIYDALEMTFMNVKVPKDPHCHLCGPNPTITKLLDYEISCTLPPPPPPK